MTPEFDRFKEGFANISRTGCPPTMFVGDIVLHSCAQIDLEFTGIDRSSEACIVLSHIDVISVALGVVDVFFGTVNTQPVFSDLLLELLQSGLPQIHR